MLRDSVVAVVVAVVTVVVRTRPRAIPLSMITMRKSTHGFPFLSYMSMGLRYYSRVAWMFSWRISLCFVSFRFVSFQSKRKRPTLWDVFFDILIISKGASALGMF